MRVLSIGSMYPPHSLGGYEVIWRSAVRHLRAQGHHASVLTTDYRRPDAEGGEDEEVHRELRWYWRDHRFPRMGPRAIVELERHNATVLERHLDDLQPDVVAWWAMGGMSLSLIERVRRRGIAAVGFVIDDWMDYGPKVDRWQRACRVLGPGAPRLARAAGIPSRLDLGPAARWEFVSDFCRRRAERLHGTLPEAGVLRAGVESELFASGPAAVRDWEWRLAYVGRVDARKGIAVAIEALALLPATATLDVVGAGEGRVLGELQRLVAERGLEGRVTFRTPPRSALPEVYAAADCVLFPVTWEEPWGLVPLEAMSMGRPVLATGTGGSGEYLRDGVNALLTRPGDAGELAAGVGRLARDPDLRSRLRDGGLETAARYTDEAYNSGVESALGDRAAGRPPPASRR